MTQARRIAVAVLVLAVLVVALLLADALRTKLTPTPETPQGDPTLAAGSLPIYLDGRLMGGVLLADLEPLQKVHFVEPAEGKTQEGWLLRDVILLRVPRSKLRSDSTVKVSSSARDKSAQLTWAEVDDPDNWVMFDVSNRGTLKLVAVLESLDSRNEWVQDSDRIEITTP